MKDITRRLFSEIMEDLSRKDHITVIYGPRQVGKTTLLMHLKTQLSTPRNTSDKTISDTDVLLLNGDNAKVQEVFSSSDPIAIKSYIGKTNYLFIDEAQRIENIGVNLKIIVDQLPHLKTVVTGSSSLELASKINEPLTGRKKVFMLYPIWAGEYIDSYSNSSFQDNLEMFLRFGMYPKILSGYGESDIINYLEEIVEATLFKDILDLEDVKNPKILRDLLTLIAFQIGREVALSELSKSLGVALETVQRYLDLLEKAFILVNLRGFSRNLRKEVTKTSRYYFFDLGVRNAIIRNYNTLKLRDDVGMLWENFLFMERLKKNSYKGISPNKYFWRTYDKKEIDLVEEYGGKLHGYEFKWQQPKTKTHAGGKEFVATYPNADFKLIDRSSYLEFVS